MGGVQRQLDVGGIGAREFADGFAGDRRGVGEVLAVERRDKLTIDVVAVARLEGKDGASTARLCVDHAGSPKRRFL
ncbi:hypothetical protein D9M73_294210 [compost metagenome]